jgi:hypothetical protein
MSTTNPRARRRFQHERRGHYGVLAKISRNGFYFVIDPMLDRAAHKRENFSVCELDHPACAASMNEIGKPINRLGPRARGQKYLSSGRLVNARIQLGFGHGNAAFRVIHPVSSRLSLDPA